jgi:hypothetical protein
VRKDDCCKVKFHILNTDQDQSSEDFQIMPDSFNSILSMFPEVLTIQPVSIPMIKTFQALFRRVTGPLYKKHQQLIL